MHPTGHAQQYFTHYRHVGEMVGIDCNLSIDTVRQRGEQQNAENRKRHGGILP